MTAPFSAPDPAARPAWAPLLGILAAGLQAAEPERAVRDHLAPTSDGLRLGRGVGAEIWPLAPEGRLFVIAAGKAAAPMLAAAEEILGDRMTAALGVGVRGTKRPLANGMLYEGGHPQPDPSSLMAARHVQRLLADTTEHDAVLLLLSGGASSLLELPPKGVPLVDIASLTTTLLSCGATIDEINTVRRHVSAIKGGGLLRLAAPARVATLALSDVIGGRPETIGGGPSVGDPTTFADAGAVLSRFSLWGDIPESVGRHLRAGLAGEIAETVAPGDPLLAGHVWHTIGSVGTAVQAAAEHAAALGYTPLVLSTSLVGEAREVGKVLAAVARECVQHGQPAAPPACLLAGGETTVTLRRLGGEGGRCRELALGAALALDGLPDVSLAAFGTDGRDGAGEAAGALVDGTSADRARAAGRDPRRDLDHHHSGPFFDTLGDAVVTGPTGTNVNDLLVLLIGRPNAEPDADVRDDVAVDADGDAAVDVAVDVAVDPAVDVADVTSLAVGPDSGGT